MVARPGLLWYPDGSSDAIVHRHEAGADSFSRGAKAWTALMSFGSPRILTIAPRFTAFPFILHAEDGHPVLLRDGDLIIFGTQRHGVPKMCSEGLWALEGLAVLPLP